MRSNFHRSVAAWAVGLSLGWLPGPPCRAESPKPHPYRLPATSVKERVIWGAICEAPGGPALSFGGEDQASEDGIAHTRLRTDGEWHELHDELIRGNPHQASRDRAWELRELQKRTLSRARFLYLEGLPADELARRITAEVLPDQQRLSTEINALALAATAAEPAGKQRSDSAALIEAAQSRIAALLRPLQEGLTPQLLAQMRDAQVQLEKLSDALAAEPPARALSPIVYEPNAKVFVLFGGDHGDYLTNDTWVFDPATRKWSLRHPPSAPPPRARHEWKLGGDGKLILTAGYTYFSNTDYMGGQYVDLNDGEWIYDVAADAWAANPPAADTPAASTPAASTPAGGKSTSKSEPAGSRTYRTGPFLPEFFFQGPRPDASEFQARLKSLPANVWTKMKPPQLPQLNRDWGTAVLDPDRDLILRWSGGHCAHGGSDVLEYHLASGRWELCYPVEFPLGQLYDNTEYPRGYNFNRRPWVSGHTYQNYGLDPVLKKMLFLGHPPFAYLYDPDAGDWSGRVPLPAAMSYSGAMYTLTTTPTPKGLVCWTVAGQVFRFDAAAGRWDELHPAGEKLPGSSVDNSTVVYDSRRDRLLFLRKPYGDAAKYDGEIYAMYLKTSRVGRLTPAGKDGAGAIPYLCQIRYDPTHDVLLAGATLPAGAEGFRRTPAYDCATNRWVSYKITGEDPSGEKGRNVSLGLMFDARRNLFWAVDARSQVFALRFDPKAAEEADAAAR